MKLIFAYIRKHLGIFLLSTLFLTMEAMADLLQPALMSGIVDKGIKNASVRRICGYGAVMLGIALTGAVCAVVRNRFASKVSQTIGKELRRDMYHNVSLLSMENIDRLRPASIITRITNDVAQVQEFINGIMRIMVKAPITCIGRGADHGADTPAGSGDGGSSAGGFRLGACQHGDRLSPVRDSAETDRRSQWRCQRISFLSPGGEGFPSRGRGD